MAPLHTQKLRQEVSGQWGDWCKLFFWDLVLQMVSHSLSQRSSSGTPATAAARQGCTPSPLYFLFLCNIRSGAIISTSDRGGRKELPLLCPFFVHICLDHLCRVTLAAHGLAHPSFTSFLWCSACAHWLSIKFHSPTSLLQATHLQQKRQAKWRKVRSGGEPGLGCSWGSHSLQAFQVLLAH